MTYSSQCALTTQILFCWHDAGVRDSSNLRCESLGVEDQRRMVGRILSNYGSDSGLGFLRIFGANVIEASIRPMATHGL
jgi:hypothetical protein